MVMERVASEYNKLQYNVSHASGHPLIEEMTPRIAQVTTTLQNHLQDTFQSSLEHRDREKLIQSLQTYSSIGRQSAAEEMFQNVIVLPYMEQVSFFLLKVDFSCILYFTWIAKGSQYVCFLTYPFSPQPKQGPYWDKPSQPEMP